MSQSPSVLRNQSTTALGKPIIGVCDGLFDKCDDAISHLANETAQSPCELRSKRTIRPVGENLGMYAQHIRGFSPTDFLIATIKNLLKPQKGEGYSEVFYVGNKKSVKFRLYGS